MIYYIHYIKKNDSKLSGIAKKIDYQIKAFNNLGIKVKEIEISLNKNLVNKVLKRIFTFFPSNELKEIIIKNNDCVYIRYPFADSNLIKLLKNIRNKNLNNKIVIEIATYPYEKELPKWQLKKDKKYRKELSNYVDRIVTFSSDDEIYGIKTIKTGNGIDISDYRIKKNIHKDTFNIISVSSLCKWHVYDRVIEGLKNYYSNSQNNRVINFMIVGEGPEKEYLQDLINKYRLNKYCKLVGYKNGKELDKLFDESNLAFSCLGLHRKNVLALTSLKNREYCVRGIPFVDVAEDQDFENFKYRLKINSDETPIDMNQILDFYDDIYTETLSKEMNEYAKEYLTWEKKLKCVQEYYLE
ncbi:glycosyltransferase [Clostridium perfringens]|uniref:glycosyltransferase n=1 Tax=Clostridium perfringens TaxID=1502 RepID=UPI0039EC5244